MQLPPTAELDPLLRWLNDFPLYDNDGPRSFQPSATPLSVPDESARLAESTKAATARRSQGLQLSTITLSVEDELHTLDQIVDPESIDLRRSAINFLLSQIEQLTHVEELGEAIAGGNSRSLLSLAQIAEHI